MHALRVLPHQPRIMTSKLAAAVRYFRLPTLLHVLPPDGSIESHLTGMDLMVTVLTQRNHIGYPFAPQPLIRSVMHATAMAWAHNASTFVQLENPRTECLPVRGFQVHRIRNTTPAQLSHHAICNRSFSLRNQQDVPPPLAWIRPHGCRLKGYPAW